eukprot:m.89428 g.89428  ORF g.89428 m.89428 type:complete len:944 (-) comp11742_c0_seq1:45-2876(-)
MLEPGAEKGVVPVLGDMSARQSQRTEELPSDARMGTGKSEEGLTRWSQLEPDTPDRHGSVADELDEIEEVGEDGEEGDMVDTFVGIEVHASSADGDLRLRSMKRKNPLYQGSIRGDNLATKNPPRMANVRVLEAELLPQIRRTSRSDCTVPPDVAKMRTISKSMKETDRLEVLHSVKMGAISVDEAVQISARRASGETSTPSPDLGHRVPTPQSPISGPLRTAASELTALSASLRGGQWKEMMVALDDNVLKFSHPQHDGRVIDLNDSVTVTAIDDVPVEGSCSLRIVTSDAADIYFFADSNGGTAQWHTWIQKAIESAPSSAAPMAVPSTKPEVGDFAGLRPSIAADEMVPPWLATKLGHVIARDSTIGRFPKPPSPEQQPIATDVAGLSGSRQSSQESEEEEIIAEVIRETPISSQVSTRRSLRHRASFNGSEARSRPASFRGVNVTAPGVERLIEPYDEDAEHAAVIAKAIGEECPEIILDECDERVGEMDDTNHGDTVLYLEGEIQRLRDLMDTGFDGGTNSGYSARYQSMAVVGREQPSTASLKEVNKMKNRYGNIMAYEHSRVVLDTINEDPDTDYINANWIDGFKAKQAYIATQGPVPNSFTSFWRMVWEHDSEIIVMVTHEVEKGRMKCHRYWPDPTSEPPVKQLRYGEIIVTHLLTQAHKHFALRVFELSHEGSTKTVKQYAYLSWPDHGVPLATTELLGFRNAVRNGRTDLSKPLVVHCSAGVGRTGTYIAIDRLLEQCFDQTQLDVDVIVRDMRLSRNFMVQTEIQYIFIHRAVMDAMTELYAEETAKAAILEQSRPSALAKQRATVERAEAAAAAARAAAEAEARDIEDAKRRLEEDRRQMSSEAEKAADVETMAVTEHSVKAAQAVIQTSIKDRIKFLDQAEERWLEAYRTSVEEWKDRNQFGAENYDVSSALTPIQSRLEALRQKGMMT